MSGGQQIRFRDVLLALGLVQALGIVLFPGNVVGAAEPPAGLADPTRPAIGISAGIGMTTPIDGGPVLQSVLISPTRKLVVISGQSYTIGGRVDGAVVVKIKPYEVILKQAGRETSLRLLPKLKTNNLNPGEIDATR